MLKITERDIRFDKQTDPTNIIAYSLNRVQGKTLDKMKL